MTSPTQVSVVTSQARRHLWLIELAGAVTEQDLGSLNAATTTALGRHAGPIAFALSEVTWCDATLVDHLLDARRRRMVVLIAPSRPARRLLARIPAAARLPVYSDLTAALSATEPR